MLTNRMVMTIAAATLLLSCFAIAARAEETAVPKRTAHPKLEPTMSIKPGITAAEQEELKKELSNAAAG